MRFITNRIAWLLKVISMATGIIGAILKLLAGIINVFQPAEDHLVNKIADTLEKIQKILFKGQELLKKFGE